MPSRKDGCARITMRTYTCTFTYACTFTFTRYLCMYIDIYICIYRNRYIYICLRIYIYIYIITCPNVSGTIQLRNCPPFLKPEMAPQSSASGRDGVARAPRKSLLAAVTMLCARGGGSSRAIGQATTTQTHERPSRTTHRSPHAYTCQHSN